MLYDIIIIILLVEGQKQANACAPFQYEQIMIHSKYF